MGLRIIAWTAIFLLLVVPASNGEASSETIVLEFIPGAATSTIIPILVGDQREELSFVGGNTISRIVSSNPNQDTHWPFNIKDSAWKGRLGDARLYVEYFSTGSQINKAFYDSNIHEIHSIKWQGKSDPLSEDKSVGLLSMTNFSELENFHTAEFPLPKAFFANRCGWEKSDFSLQRWSRGWFGFQRIKLTIVPVDASKVSGTSSIEDFIFRVYKRYLDRGPSTKELNLYKSAFQMKRLTISEFLMSVLKTSEFIEVNFRPFEKPEAIRRLFKRFLGRSPSWREEFFSSRWEIPAYQDRFINDMIAGYYPDAIDALFR